MATDAVITPVSRKPVYRPVNRTLERAFYLGMAVLMCVCVYIGFSPTYFGAGMLRAPLPSPILHVHGAVLNDYNDGGYLIWQLYPEWPVTMDGRVDVYGPQLVVEYAIFGGAPMLSPFGKF